MGCKYACTCGGMCPGCGSYQPESYFGEAEDLLSQQMGYRNYEDHMASSKQEQDHYAHMEKEYYVNHPDNPKNQTAKD